jgi:hypothetical protein
MDLNAALGPSGPFLFKKKYSMIMVTVSDPYVRVRTYAAEQINSATGSQHLPGAEPLTRASPICELV